MKREFQIPELEISKFSYESVVTASGAGSVEGNYELAQAWLNKSLSETEDKNVLSILYFE